MEQKDQQSEFIDNLTSEECGILSKTLDELGKKGVYNVNILGVIMPIWKTLKLRHESNKNEPIITAVEYVNIVNCITTSIPKGVYSLEEISKFYSIIEKMREYTKKFPNLFTQQS